MNAWKSMEVSLNFLKFLSEISVFFYSERQRLNFEKLKPSRQRSPFSRHPFRHLIKTTTFRVSLTQAPGSSLTKTDPMQEHSQSRMWPSMETFPQSKPPDHASHWPNRITTLRPSISYNPDSMIELCLWDTTTWDRTKPTNGCQNTISNTWINLTNV